MMTSMVNGTKVAAFPKGKGSCPYCGNDVIAKCGSKVIWHWAHSVTQSCDPWWENETPWHRAWKAHWETEFQEVIRFDERTGEKHIADVKNKNGFVLEFQHSPMSSDELASREQFYGEMAWVVNAKRFAANIEFRARLPNPQLPASLDMRVRRIENSQEDFLFYRLSENEPGATMVEVHGSHRIRDFIETTHVGHRLFRWRNPRSVWFRATRPVFFDFGGDVMWRLQRFNEHSEHCLAACSKAAFIGLYGGVVEAQPCGQPDLER